MLFVLLLLLPFAFPSCLMRSACGGIRRPVTINSTVPELVNLIEFDKRFNSTCCNRAESTMRPGGSAGSTYHAATKPFDVAMSYTNIIALSHTSARLQLVRVSFNSPASIFEKSKISLMIVKLKKVIQEQPINKCEKGYKQERDILCFYAPRSDLYSSCN